jgi:SOS-response transcriptional repressor LexA
VYGDDGSWQHEEIVFEPLNEEYDPIRIRADMAESFTVVAEFVRVLGEE